MRCARRELGGWGSTGSPKIERHWSAETVGHRHYQPWHAALPMSLRPTSAVARRLRAWRQAARPRLVVTLEPDGE